MNPPETLTPREAALVAAIAAEPTATHAALARSVGVGARHIRRLLERERVKVALDAAAVEGLREACQLAGRASARAVRNLVELSTTAGAGSAPRVAASRALVDIARGLDERAVILSKIEELEKQIAAVSPPEGRRWQS